MYRLLRGPQGLSGRVRKISPYRNSIPEFKTPIPFEMSVRERIPDYFIFINSAVKASNRAVILHVCVNLTLVVSSFFVQQILLKFEL